MDGPSPASSESRRKRRRLSNSSAARRPSEAASSAGELGSMRRGLAKGSSSFVGSGSGIYFVRTVQAAFARNYSRRGSEVIDADIVPGEDDRLQTRNAAGSLWSMDEVDFTGPQSNASISFEELVQWSQQYFENWHPPFPFLLGSVVLDLLEKTSLHGIDSLSVTDDIVVRSILSISVADRRQIPKENGRLVPPSLVFLTVNDAITRLAPVLLQTSSLAGLQALVAAQSFLISMLNLNAASRIGGLIIRTAFQLGLHRCPSRYEQFSLADADIRRRLFWTIYTYERYLSQALGLPIDLKDEDIDVCYPDNEVHHTSGRDRAFEEARAHDPRLLLLPTLLARHGKIRGMVLELRHITLKSRTADPDEVALIEAEISKWWNEAQDLLDPHFIDDNNGSEMTNGQSGDLMKSSHKLLLVVQKHESTILLNRPVIASGHNTSLFSAAMQKCIGASKQIVSKVYQHMHEGMNESGSSEGKIYNALFWPGFTWCVWMSGLILLYAASEGHYSAQIAQREAERCVKILEALSLRGSFWPGACATALKDLQKALAHKSVMKSVDVVASRQTDHVTANDNISIPSNPSPITKSNLANDEVTSKKTQPQPNNASASPHVSSTNKYNSFGYPQNQQIDVSDSTNSNLNNFENRLSQTPVQGSSGQGDFGQPITDLNFGDWQGLGVNHTFGDEKFDDFNDIFQIMDVSYQMSEQMFDPLSQATPRF